MLKVLIFTVVHLLAITGTGQTTWRKTYGGHGSENGREIIALTNGNFLCVGSTGSFGLGGGDAYVLMLDPSGEIIWSKYLGGIGVDEAVGVVIYLNDFLIVGSTSEGEHGGYDIMAVRIDMDGEVMWQRSYGTEEWDFGHAVGVDIDEFYLLGSSYIQGIRLPYLMKCNSNGDTLWSRIYSEYEGVSFTDGEFNSVHSNDDGMYVCGSIGTTADPSEAMVASIDENGDVTWMTLFGGEGDDIANDLTSDVNGNLYVCGSSSSNAVHLQIYLQEVMPDGELSWQQFYGVGDDFEGNSIDIVPNSGFAISGYNSVFSAGGKDMYLLRTDEEGWFIFGKNYGGMEYEEAHGVAVLNDGFIVIGTTEGYGPGNRSMYVVRSDEFGETEDDTVYETFDPVSVPSHYRQPFNLYPNPVVSEGVLNISSPQQELVRSITLTDLSGRVIVQQDCFACTSFKLPSVSHGLYNLMVEIDGGVRSVHPIIIN